MNKPFHDLRHLILSVSITCFVALGSATADENGDTGSGIPSPDADNAVGVNQNVIGKISDDYRSFLGENTEAVVTGLRTGNEITLTTTGPDGTTTTSFTPPTGKMGYGNVSHAIGLAQEQLGQYGITEPTADELQAALIGGEIGTSSGGVAAIDGVLTLRSEGMGWGEIAHQYGVKLGYVVSSVKAGKGYAAINGGDQVQTTSAGSGNRVKAYGKGIVTAAGNSASASVKQDKVKTNQGKSNAYGRGIVTASGSSVAAGNSAKGALSASSPKGHAYGHGIVTAAGASSSTASAAAGKKGNGLAKGHSK